MLGSETIAAIASGVGEAGIGIVRVSGADAVSISAKVFRPRRGLTLERRRSYCVVYGWIVDSAAEVIDEALALIMRGPRSYTGEDVVELHCHGGQVAVRRVLEVVLEGGARLAEPGEFTKRAFLSGRIDLVQAEAVIDVIRARTDRAMKAAVHQLRGEMGHGVRAIRSELMELIAFLEADIDFPELDLEASAQGRVIGCCQEALDRLRQVLAAAGQGSLLREGVRVVLAGRPNVGKSSLMNRLVRGNRSIVTAVPGTTRDVIEEWISIHGLPVVLADTAGIRDTGDEIERLGVERTRLTLDRADLVLVVVDANCGLLAEDLALIKSLPEGAKRIGVANKADLNPAFGTDLLATALGGSEAMAVSAANGDGIAELERAIVNGVGLEGSLEAVSANSRQREALQQAIAHLEAAVRTQMDGFGSDMISIDIRAAWAVLGEIIGEAVGEDLLDQIFGRFCIGK